MSNWRSRFDDPNAFEQAKNDIVEQLEPLVQDNQSQGNYSEWLETILDHLKDLRMKDFF